MTDLALRYALPINYCSVQCQPPQQVDDQSDLREPARPPRGSCGASRASARRVKMC